MPVCFFLPAHGPSARHVRFAPEGGALRPVAACGACADEIEAGRVPGGWTREHPPLPSGPAHAGYAGRGGSSDDEVGGTSIGLGLVEFVFGSW